MHFLAEQVISECNDGGFLKEGLKTYISNGTDIALF